MSDLFWLSEAQVDRLRPYFPKSRGKPRVDDRRVLSGIIFIQRNGLMWKHAPAAYGPPKTLYNRWKRWSRMGVFATIMTELAAQAQDTEILMIDATHAKAHRTASSMAVQRGARTADRADQRRSQLETARPGGREGSPDPHVPLGRPDVGLYRRTGSALLDPAYRRLARGPGLRCRLVPQRPDRHGDIAVYPIPPGSEGSDPARR